MTLHRILAATTAATAAVASLATATPASAQDAGPIASGQDAATTLTGQPYVLPEITLSAYQTEEELGRTGATVEVVTDQDIERRGTVRVADYLATLPGVSATTNGGFGAQTTLRLRGLPGQYVKVLVDGIDVSDPAAPQIRFDPGALMTGDIARIEVLKGPQSALYGSEAIGGVVSISSLGAAEPGTHQRATLEYGSFNTRRASYGVTSSGDRHAVALTLQHLDTDGFSVADENDGNTEADGARARRVTLSGRFDATDAVTIGAAGFWQQSEVETDTTFPSLQDSGDSSNGITRGLRVFADHDAGGIRHGISAQHSQTSRQENYGGFTYPYDGDRSEVEYKGSADPGAQVTLAWGGTHSRESFAASGTEASYINNSAFAEVRYAATPDLDIAVSARHDRNSQFGGKATGRLALAWRPDDRLTVRAQWGTGYRAPSLYELYAPWGGNPDLEPETARGGEIGVEYALATGAMLRATAFASTITNLIEYPVNGYTQVPGDTRTRGVELSGEAPLGEALRLSGNFTYTDAEDKNGEPLNRVPARVLNLRLDGDISARARFGLDLAHVSGMRDGGEMPSYTVIGAQAEYDLTDQATGYVRIENLLDEEYQVLRGYGTSDRAVYAGVRARF